MSWGIPIIGDLIDLGSEWLKGKQKRSQAKAEAEAAVMVSAATSQADWERYMAQASGSSWKDEYWSVILSIPPIMCFTGNADAALAGFAALSEMPEYFQYFLGIAITASFGVKGFKSFKAGR